MQPKPLRALAPKPIGCHGDGVPAQAHDVVAHNPVAQATALAMAARHPSLLHDRYIPPSAGNAAAWVVFGQHRKEPFAPRAVQVPTLAPEVGWYGVMGGAVAQLQALAPQTYAGIVQGGGRMMEALTGEPVYCLPVNKSTEPGDWDAALSAMRREGSLAVLVDHQNNAFAVGGVDVPNARMQLLHKPRNAEAVEDIVASLADVRPRTQAVLWTAPQPRDMRCTQITGAVLRSAVANFQASCTDLEKAYERLADPLDAWAWLGSHRRTFPNLNAFTTRVRHYHATGASHQEAQALTQLLNLSCRETLLGLLKRARYAVQDTNVHISLDGRPWLHVKRSDSGLWKLLGEDGLPCCPPDGFVDLCMRRVPQEALAKTLYWFFD